MKLTADCGGALERLEHLRVHRNEEALVLRDGQVPCPDALRDPVVEFVSDDCGAHIADPLLRELAQLLVVGHVRDDDGVLEEEVEDVFQLQALLAVVLSEHDFYLRRDVNVHNVLHWQDLLFARNEI